jgi:hypothetical protein
VQNGVSNGGAHAIVASAIGTSGQHLAVTPIRYDSTLIPESVVSISVDFLTDGTNSNFDPKVRWNPFAVFGDAGFVGQMGVWDTGEVVLGLQSSALFGPVLSLGDWHKIEMVLDFSARELSGFLNGAEFASAPMFNSSVGLTSLSLGVNGSFPDSTSTAYFDNLSVVSSVPVPAAIWLFGTALIGLVGFSKRRKTT